MKAALAVAAAEFRGYRFLLWGAILWGLIGDVAVSVINPLAEGGTPHRPALAFAPVMVGVIVTSTQMGLALLLGAAAVSRDLADRRVGFYLARPLSPFAYWAGKLAAAFCVAYAAGWLVLVPGFVVDSFLGRVGAALDAVLTRGWPTFVLAGMLASAFLVAAASAAAGAVRSRSRLLVLDIVMLALTGAAVVVALGSTWDAGTSAVVARFAFGWLFVLAILALLGAGAAQVCLGRLDTQRGHAWLSAIAWGGLLACVGGMLLFSRSVASATPADLRMPHAVSVHAPEADGQGAEPGGHVVLEGASSRWSPHFNPGFLLDARGRSTRIGGFDNVTGLAWSDDGRHFAWSRHGPNFADVPVFGGAKPLQAVPGFAPGIWRMDLGQPEPRPRRVVRTSQALEGLLALSPSGQRLLVATAAGKRVLDSDGGGRIARLDEPSRWSGARFLSETLVRALRAGPGQGRTVDWDLDTGGFTERGAIALQGDPGWFASLTPTPDWQRVLRLDASGLYLHDLDGRLLATLVERWPTRLRVAGPLSGDRLGSIEEDALELRLRVFDAEGRPVTDARFKGRFPIRVGGESAPGLLALGVSGFAGREALFIDLATGALVRREAGLLPALREWGTGLGARGRGAGRSPQPGSFATRLFLGDEGVVLLDPATGSRNVLVRPSDPLEN